MIGQLEIGKAFWYFVVNATIPVIAFVGYMITKNYHYEVYARLILANKLKNL